MVPAPGETVRGVVYSLSRGDADSLDTWQDARFDGTGACFHSPVTVIDPCGARHEALLYKKDMLGAPRKPSTPYLEHLVRGARARGLPQEYVAALRETASKKAGYPVPVLARGRQGVLRGDSCADCGGLTTTAD